jgi:transcriptional regulator with XRE-family HTH domain
MKFYTNVEVGQNIKARRIVKGLTQTQLAEVLGINQSSVAKIESGDREVSAREALLLADLFVIPSNELFCDEKSSLEMTGVPPIVRAWIDTYLEEKNVLTGPDNKAECRLCGTKYDSSYINNDMECQGNYCAGGVGDIVWREGESPQDKWIEEQIEKRTPRYDIVNCCGNCGIAYIEDHSGVPCSECNSGYVTKRQVNVNDIEYRSGDVPIWVNPEGLR